MELRKMGFRMTTTMTVLAIGASGLAMLVRHPHITTEMSAMGYPAFFLGILGVWKVLGALTVALPGLPRLKEWAYAGMVFDLTGAALSRVLGGSDFTHVLPPMTIGCAVVVSWALRPASRRLLSARESPRGTICPAAWTASAR